uniref:NAC transcription factor 25 n=1 Tax=Tanacetum cinerariifolium TaxID=118510 RepID=A0A699K0M1_TANCI|nr:NAC transcription factor 25 [Tanacetum cinerariifolium]
MICDKDEEISIFLSKRNIERIRKTHWCMTEFITMNQDEAGFAICKVREEATRALDDTFSDDYQEEENEDESEDDDSDEE